MVPKMDNTFCLDIYFISAVNPKRETSPAGEQLVSNLSHFRDGNQFRKPTLDHPDDYQESEISATLISLHERPLSPINPALFFGLCLTLLLKGLIST
jgi:hypothetical protein